MDIRGLIESLVSEKKVEYAEFPDIQWKIHCSTNVTGRASEIEFKRVLSNLINNSVESIEQRGEIKLQLLKDGEQIKMQISDTGCGMSVAEVQSIGRLGLTTKAQGHGLGVQAAQKYMNAIGGRIEYTSQKGLGTTVQLTWPA